MHFCILRKISYFVSVLKDPLSKIFFAITLFVFFGLKGFSQNKIDSLDKIINSAQGSIKADAMLSLASFIISENETRGLQLAKDALEISDQENFLKGKAIANLILCTYETGKKSDELFKTGFDQALSLKDPKVIIRAVRAAQKLYVNDGEPKLLAFTKRALSVAVELKNPILLATIYRSNGYYFYNTSDFEKAVFNFKEALRYYQSEKKLSESAGMVMNLGVMFYKMSKFDSSLVYYLKAKDIFEKLEDPQNLASAITNVAITLEDLGRNQEALTLMKSAVLKYKPGGDSELLAGAYEIMANIYGDLGKKKENLDYLLLCMNIRERIKDSSNIDNSYMNLSVAYYGLNNIERSLMYAWKSIKLDLHSGNLDKLSTSYSNLATLLNDLNKLDSAIYYEELSLKMRMEIGNDAEASASCSHLGEFYDKKGEKDKALSFYIKACELGEESKFYKKLPGYLNTIGAAYIERKDYSKAIQYLLRSEKYAQSSNLQSDKQRVFELLALCYDKIGNTKNAYKYLSAWKFLTDSLKESEANRFNAELLERYETDKKEKQITILKKDQELTDLIVAKQNEDIDHQRKITFSVLIGLLVITVFAFFLFKSNKEKKRANLIILNQKKEVEGQKDVIEEKNKEILDSIHYAKKIQQTLLVNQELMKNNFTDHFILFKPKDIVSGDFYWGAKKDDLFYLAVCDSTGHGVPGAFMSLLNISFLNEAINENGKAKPNDIFNYVRQRLIESVSQDGGQDGMDGILLCFDKKNNTLTYSAAHNAPILIRGGVLFEQKADKMPVGKWEKKEPFVLHEIKIQKGDRLYLCTDGFADQFGGPKGKKFKYKQMTELIINSGTLSINDQNNELLRVIEAWKGDLEQVDDICIVGLEI